MNVNSNFFLPQTQRACRQPANLDCYLKIRQRQLAIISILSLLLAQSNSSTPPQLCALEAWMRLLNVSKASHKHHQSREKQ